jgi:hypothetical protein
MGGGVADWVLGLFWLCGARCLRHDRTTAAGGEKCGGVVTVSNEQCYTVTTKCTIYCYSNF